MSETAVAGTGVRAARLLLTDAVLPAHGPAEPTDPTPAEGWRSHLAAFGPRPGGTPALVAALERSRLTGQGGAHVPVAAKWRRTLAGHGPLTLVANGAESEPVAAKDGTLLRQRPHLVIDGLLLAAEALGAQRAVIWLHGDDLGARRALRIALAERPWEGTAPSVELLDGPVHYLAGEASAIAQAAAGGPALPTVRRREVPGRPRTLVHNVETLARIALLARDVEETGTRLVTVLGNGRAVVEVESATTFTELLADLGWTEAPQAVLLGGYGGLWASWSRVAHLSVDEAALRREGLSLGAGVVAPLGAWACGIHQTARLVDYLASMSARQCGPCVFGLPALGERLGALAVGSADVGRLLDDAASIEGRGACHHPDGATRLVASAVSTFADDVAAHSAGRPCGSGALAWPELAL
ncbi:NADH-ubiquinone oxidoreductase-F iron-sulfur binding region domain-containing protein [Isoptericola sp. b441]|uniref:NADH-ubiquinone oxidoreductase-F iron-sulfur binding region domain-containing protein n=1 Tax=Actinotalea lenta TaxID=3064654 RepID=A0ABT9D7D5_9CELL|nr:NADH-ubiquinone oxidoreductase-F iron-sulfur binding region domain-containing protein [Isoptericola sp. b441]MDO8106341.1 NADH-ubiquinone oxidoreductase-F iron-sulfur binding region domain-containing protein [Isoptericola sp. b441]